MGKVNSSDYSTKDEKLGQEDFEQDVAVLTLEAVEQIDVPDANSPTGTRKAMKLIFADTPKVHWPGKAQIDALVERLGDDDDDWVGQQVVMEKANGTFRGKPYANVRVSDAEDWDGHLKAFKSPKRRK